MAYKLLRTRMAPVIGLLALMAAGGAHAALVNFTVSGTIDGSQGPYGLSVGDVITASGTFDDGAMSVSPYIVYFGSGYPTNTMTITANSLTLNQTDDDYYTMLGSPKLEFDGSGDLIGLGFRSTSPDGSTFDSGALAFILNDSDWNYATGGWDASSFTMAPVPVPAAVWLMSSGLLGLAGFARRRARVA